MKKILICLAFINISIFYSCSSSFLDEVPLDQYSAENAYNNIADFNASLYNLYNITRLEFYANGDRRPFDYIFGCDIVFDGQPDVERHTTMASAYAPIGNVNIIHSHWTRLYKIISEANTIISRVPRSSMTAAEKTLVDAKARFFRALAYRTLAYLYGGVPLTLEELTTSKTDYVRATKTEVLNQAIADLKIATTNLPDINKVQDGEVNKLAAYHLLSEVYLAAGRFQEAADAATEVINSPLVHLMQNRFGTKANEAQRDVYWDLFQKGNQNRKSGNMEALLVIQFETDLPGGGSVSTGTSGSYQGERVFSPGIGNLRIGASTVPPVLFPASDYSSGGRGVGWGLSTKYFSNTIWESDFNNDIRNANHNFVRVFTCTNPKSPIYGQTFSTENPPAGITVPSRVLYAYQSKVTTPGDHPDGLFENKAQLTLKSTAGGTYSDQYMFRMAETYLLRAEAYLGLNDPGKAAADINVVRSRAKASPVTAANVNIDYILDERMRELGCEEKRRITLMRLGLWYDRVKKCNPYYSDALPLYNVWPIPAAEIERNINGHLEQNQGY